MSSGQRIALEQLRHLARIDQSPIEITDVRNSLTLDSTLAIDIDLDCSGYVRVDGGLPLQDRERFELLIPAGFPFEPPAVRAPHLRFAGFSHVQWGRQLCLYQSVQTQWLPDQGMRGFLEQLDEWLRRGARNELDPADLPRHPPAAYLGTSTTICVTADTPSFRGEPWIGFAALSKTKPGLLDLISWHPDCKAPSGTMLAPAVLLDFELPFEWPATVRDLVCQLNCKGRLGWEVLGHLMAASLRVPDGVPLYLAIGAPSRSAARDIRQRCQHLAFWEIPATEAAGLRAASIALQVEHELDQIPLPPEFRKLVDLADDRLLAWCRNAPVRWCRVMENRPEIVTRRDEGATMDWFAGKRVAIWGCGAIGSHIAEHLARAGVAKLVLYDKGRVTRGILVRQNFTVSDINELKVDALAGRVHSISPRIEVESRNEDIVSKTLNRADWDAGIDIVIDATAALSVRSKLESVLKRHERRVPIASVMISATAQRALATLARTAYGAGPRDVLRRLGLAAMSRDWLERWVSEFWSRDAAQGLRQPEPGCSDPTFVGSNVDVACLSARALNSLAKALRSPSADASGFLLALSIADREQRFRFRPDIRWVANSIDFRLAANAWRDMLGWIRTSARERSPEHETGGLLFGELDETSNIAWVTHVSGPPPDSVCSPDRFVCGTHGTAALAKDHRELSRGSVRFLGMWHSHPKAAPRPSRTDYQGMRKLLASQEQGDAPSLMVIVGHAATPQPSVAAFVCRQQAARAAADGADPDCKGGVTTPAPPAPLGKKIGLALSGGGARAMAFHLGTLRALQDLDLLEEVDVISGVSGGSVMTGLLGYTEAPFDSVDRQAVELLRRGLMRATLRKLLLSPRRLVPFLMNAAFAALLRPIIDIASCVKNFAAPLIPRTKTHPVSVARRSWPRLQHYNLLHIFSDVVADLVGTMTCDSATRRGISVVFNACELRTGTAFRMSNECFGSYRFGYAPASELRLADAMSASAAYPAVIAPFDWKRTFEKDGDQAERRVIVTDGGVYENLGVSVMEPGRNLTVSKISYAPEIIIVSDAGTGQFTGETVPVRWPKRMKQVAESLMRKVQNATKTRLHDLRASGNLHAFVYVGLGQIDHRVPLKALNWVNRDQVIHYPTDFSAMPEDDLHTLSQRGESIARTLVAQYLLSD